MGTVTHTAETIAHYDLHLHSHWSYDAFTPPAAYFERARALKLRAIALSEHHVLDSLDDVLVLREEYPDVRAVIAAELSVRTARGSVDLLCYGFPVPLAPVLAPLLDRYHAWQREYGATLCRAMQALGFDYTEAQRDALLRSYRPPHVIARQGYTRVRNGVQRGYFIARGFIADEDACPAFIERVDREVGLPPYPPPPDVAPIVHEAGALIALAHPGRSIDPADPRGLDALVEECALDGIECAHPEVPADLTPMYRAYCREHGLFSVGGSDSHTPEQLGSRFARHLGEDVWLDEFLERLDARGGEGR